MSDDLLTSMAETGEILGLEDPNKQTTNQGNQSDQEEDAIEWYSLLNVYILYKNIILKLNFYCCFFKI